MTQTIVNHSDLEMFVKDLLDAAGVARDEAHILANIFIWTELIGRSNHGLIRLPAYLNRFQQGVVRSPCQPKFIPKTDTIYLLDGHHGFGLYVGHMAMLKAIELSDQHGVGIVGVHHSNHFLAGAYYVEQAAQAGKIGLALSNAFPRVAPHGGATSALGTNPFAFGAPLRNTESILVDFSTGALAGGTIKQAIVEQRQLPTGLVIDETGRDIVDPIQANQATVLPFAGAKGFCMGLLVEILSSVLTGAAMSHQIASFYRNFEEPANLGHFFLALDIAKLMPLEQYYERMEILIGFIKAAKLRQGFEEILLPGETRWRAYRRQLAEGVQLSEAIRQTLTNLANKWQVPTPFT